MNFKKFLALMLVACFSFVIVACNGGESDTTTTDSSTTETTSGSDETTTTAPVQSTTLSILNGWSDSGDSVYTITQDDTSLVVSYDKNSFSWANMAYAIDTDLSDFNKLVFSVSGQGTMMVKIQGATEAFEASIQLTAGEVTYQLNLRDYDDFLGGVTEVIIFAAPGKADDTGNFTISKFEFDEGTAYGNVLENGDSNIPQNQQEYDGTGETFDFSAGFVDNGDGIYTIDDSGEVPSVSYTKATGFEWAYMVSTVVGDFSDFDYVVLQVTGVTAGSVLLKAELSSSVQAEISGTFDVDETITICLDLTSWTDEQMDALTTILIFADGGSASASGQFTIDAAYFSKVEVVVEEPEDAYSFMTGWTEGDAGTYAFSTSVNDTTIVDYTKAAGQTWIYMSNVFSAEAAEYNTMIFTVKGTAGESIMIKPNDDGALEQTITFDGNEQTVEVSADEFTKMVIFAMPGTDSVSGSFEIVEAKLVYVEPEPLSASETYDMQNDWVDNDGGIYTFTNDLGVVTVDYDKNSEQAWAYILNTFTEDLTNLDVIELVVQGTAGEQLLIKPNNNNAYEQTITFDGTIQTVTVVVPEKLVNLLIFVDPFTGTLSGQFTIVSATVKASNPTMVNFINDLEENDAGTYAITEIADGIQVDYDVDQWSFFGVTFNAEEVATANTMVLTFNGTSGETIMIKPNNDGALEQTLTFDGTDQTVIITADSFQSLLMFADPGNVSSGTFVIKEAKVYYEEPCYDFAIGFTDGGDSVYTVTENPDGTTTIDYTKAAGQGWALVRNDFVAEDVDGFNTMTITLQGTSGLSVLVKPNDDGSLEQTITFDGTEQTFVFEASSFTTFIIFAEPGTESVSGTFTIVEAKLTYVESDAVPAYEEVVLGNLWVDNDGGIYTFTDNSGVITVDYVKAAGQEWVYMIYSIEENLENHDTLTMVFNGTAGNSIMLKPNNDNALEQTITFDGTDQTIVVTAALFTEIIIFAEPGTGDVSGSFDIVSAVISSSDATYDFTNTFTENDSSTYSFTPQVDDSVLVDYTKATGQEWVYMISDFEEAIDGLNTLTLVVQGTSGESIMIKPNNDNALEQTITFDGSVQTITISADSFDELLIFAEPGTGDVSGSFTIVSGVLSYTDAD